MHMYSNHKLLFWTALLFFVFLTLNVCILPAITNQQIYQPLPDAKPLTKDELAGKMIYIENDEPQPQVVVALGFCTTKRAPSKPSV